MELFLKENKKSVTFLSLLILEMSVDMFILDFH